ncbi:uncharacterized protein LOC142335298 [Convolutriloba macropyga]|uniref:uncharacterized protein LOC142335298 n=1 Tax=Convolutriloba macropyga TaxID=536237 RepID=UPI003F51BF0A
MPWPVIFLIPATSTVALALERYVLICLGKKADLWLTRRNRLIFYSITVISSFLPSVLILTHHIYKQIYLGTREWRIDCWDCFRQESLPIENFGRIPFVHFPAVLTSTLAYYRCIAHLKNSKQITRKNLLTRAFCILLISWFVMVTPHAVFQDYFLKGRLFSIGTFMHAHYETMYVERQIKNSTNPRAREYFVTDVLRLYRRNAILWRIEAPLRCLKLSFGFVNSVLLIVMIKPFQDPIIATFQQFKRSMLRKEAPK